MKRSSLPGVQLTFRLVNTPFVTVGRPGGEGCVVSATSPVRRWTKSPTLIDSVVSVAFALTISPPAHRSSALVPMMAKTPQTPLRRTLNVGSGWSVSRVYALSLPSGYDGLVR